MHEDIGVRGLRRELDASLGGNRPAHLLRLLEQSADGHVRQVERHATGLDAHRIEQIGDEAIHLIGRALGHGGESPAPLRFHLRHVEEIGDRHHEMQRIPQVVRDDAEHLFAAARKQLRIATPFPLIVVASCSLQRRGRCLREE